MSHEVAGTSSCAAGNVTDIRIGSIALLGSFFSLERHEGKTYFNIRGEASLEMIQEFQEMWGKRSGSKLPKRYSIRNFPGKFFDHLPKTSRALSFFLNFGSARKDNG